MWPSAMTAGARVSPSGAHPPAHLQTLGTRPGGRLAGASGPLPRALLASACLWVQGCALHAQYMRASWLPPCLDEP